MAVDLDKLTHAFPREAVKSRSGGGGQSFDYIPTHTVIHRLNDATGNNWSFEIINLEWRNDLLICTGALEIPGHGRRMGIGVQQVSERGGEDLVKGAASDCIKKCATLYGVALELYGFDIESGEIATPPSRAPHAPQTRQNAPQGDACPHEPAVPAQANTGSPGENANPATDKQLKAIFAITNKFEWDSDHAKAELLNVTGKSSTKDLSIAQASAFLDYLNAQTQQQPVLV